MFVLLTTVGVLLAGAMLPLAFDDGDEAETERDVSPADDLVSENSLLEDDMASATSPNMPPDGAAVDSNLADDAEDTATLGDDPTAASSVSEGVIQHGPDVLAETEHQPPYALGQAPLAAPESQDTEAENPFARDEWEPVVQDPMTASDDADVLASVDDILTEQEEHDAPSVSKELREGRIILHGTEGSDLVDVPHRALVEGGDGADHFRLDASTPIGYQAELPDFDPETDRLTVIWDDTAGNLPPKITFGSIEDADHLSQLIADGVVIAHVANCDGMAPADVALVARSSL